MQTPPIHELPYQDLTEEEKNVLSMWATQAPANIDLAKQLCKGTLRTSQKAFMKKVGLDCIHEHGHNLMPLPPLLTFALSKERVAMKYPFAMFLHIPLEYGRLKISAYGAVVDGNTFFYGLHALPKLVMLVTNHNNESNFTNEENCKATITIKNGLQSLINIPNLCSLKNFKIVGMDAINDIQHLKRLETLNVCLLPEEILPFFKTVKSDSLVILQINLDIKYNLETSSKKFPQEDIWEAMNGICERLPNVFLGGRKHNIMLLYKDEINYFADDFEDILDKYLLGIGR